MKIRKLISLITVFCFGITSVWSHPETFAQAVLPEQPAIALPEHIAIPSNLGTIEAQGQGAAGKPFVVFIQDAHAMVDAQKHIHKIIIYLQKNYGIKLVALEGAAKNLDPTLLRTFPDNFTKEKVLSGYLKRGELTGGEMAAIFSDQDALYHGMEDWGLYEQNYLAYLEARKNRGPFLEELKKIQNDLDQKRQKIYHKELNQFHETVTAFREQKIGLIEFLSEIASSHKPLLAMTNKDVIASLPKAGVAISERYSHLSALFQALDKDKEFFGEKFDQAVRRAAEDFKKNILPALDPQNAKPFNEASQAYFSGEKDKGEFVKVLAKMARQQKIPLQVTPELKQLIKNTQKFSAIKNGRLFEELQQYLEEVENTLISNDRERKLSEKYKELILLKSLANLELIKKQWDGMRPSSLRGARHGSWRATWQSALIKPRLLRPKSGLAMTDESDPSPLTPYLSFYELAEKRDQAFHDNLAALMKKTKNESAIVVAGGFHAKGFEEALKAQNFSYAVVMPKVRSLEGEQLYDSVMQGKLSYQPYLETTFYDAFMRHATLALVNGLNEPDFRKNLKLWRDQLLRRLAKEGRLQDAPRYTRTMDLLFKNYREKFGNTHPKKKEEVLGVIEQELKDFRTRITQKLWHRFDGQLQEFSDGLDRLAVERAGQSRVSLLGVRLALEPGNKQSDAVFVTEALSHHAPSPLVLGRSPLPFPPKDGSASGGEGGEGRVRGVDSRAELRSVEQDQANTENFTRLLKNGAQNELVLSAESGSALEIGIDSEPFFKIHYAHDAAAGTPAIHVHPIKNIGFREGLIFKPGPEYFFGRHPEYNDIVGKKDGVSRFHASIRFEEIEVAGQPALKVTIKDLLSNNNTWLRASHLAVPVADYARKEVEGTAQRGFAMISAQALDAEIAADRSMSQRLAVAEDENDEAGKAKKIRAFYEAFERDVIEKFKSLSKQTVELVEAHKKLPDDLPLEPQTFRDLNYYFFYGKILIEERLAKPDKKTAKDPEGTKGFYYRNPRSRAKFLVDEALQIVLQLEKMIALIQESVGIGEILGAIEKVRAKKAEAEANARALQQAQSAFENWVTTVNDKLRVLFPGSEKYPEKYRILFLREKQGIVIRIVTPQGLHAHGEKEIQNESFFKTLRDLRQLVDRRWKRDVWTNHFKKKEARVLMAELFAVPKESFEVPRDLVTLINTLQATVPPAIRSEVRSGDAGQPSSVPEIEHPEVDEALQTAVRFFTQQRLQRTPLSRSYFVDAFHVLTLDPGKTVQSVQRFHLESVTPAAAYWIMGLLLELAVMAAFSTNQDPAVLLKNIYGAIDRLANTLVPKEQKSVQQSTLQLVQGLLAQKSIELEAASSQNPNQAWWIGALLGFALGPFIHDVLRNFIGMPIGIGEMAFMALTTVIGVGIGLVYSMSEQSRLQKDIFLKEQIQKWGMLKPALQTKVDDEFWKARSGAWEERDILRLAATLQQHQANPQLALYVLHRLHAQYLMDRAAGISMKAFKEKYDPVYDYILSKTALKPFFSYPYIRLLAKLPRLYRSEVRTDVGITGIKGGELIAETDKFSVSLEALRKAGGLTILVPPEENSPSSKTLEFVLTVGHDGTLFVNGGKEEGVLPRTEKKALILSDRVIEARNHAQIEKLQQTYGALKSGTAELTFGVDSDQLRKNIGQTITRLSGGLLSIWRQKDYEPEEFVIQRIVPELDRGPFQLIERSELRTQTPSTETRRAEFENQLEFSIHVAPLSRLWTKYFQKFLEKDKNINMGLQFQAESGEQVTEYFVKQGIPGLVDITAHSPVLIPPNTVKFIVESHVYPQEILEKIAEYARFFFEHFRERYDNKEFFANVPTDEALADLKQKTDVGLKAELEALGYFKMRQGLEGPSVVPVFAAPVSISVPMPAAVPVAATPKRTEVVTAAPAFPRLQNETLRGVAPKLYKIAQGEMVVWEPKKNRLDISLVRPSDTPAIKAWKVKNEITALEVIWKKVRAELDSQYDSGILAEAGRYLSRVSENVQNVMLRSEAVIENLLGKSGLGAGEKKILTEVLIPALRNREDIFFVQEGTEEPTAQQIRKLIVDRQKEIALIKIHNLILNLPYGFNTEEPGIQEEERQLAAYRKNVLAEKIPAILDWVEKGKTNAEAISLVLSDVRQKADEYKEIADASLKALKKQNTLPHWQDYDRDQRRYDTELETVSYLEGLKEEVDSYDFIYETSDTDEQKDQKILEEIANRHEVAFAVTRNIFFKNGDVGQFFPLTDFDRFVREEISKGRPVTYAAAKFLSQNRDNHDENFFEFMMRYYDVAENGNPENKSQEPIIVFAKEIRHEADYNRLRGKFRSRGRIVGIAAPKTSRELRVPHWYIFAKKSGIVVLMSVDLKAKNLEFERIQPGDEAILDGRKGYFIVNPSEASVREYEGAEKMYKYLDSYLLKNATLPAFFRGRQIEIWGDETELHAFQKDGETGSMAERYGMEGLGLFRIEEAVADEHRHGIELDENRLALAVSEILTLPFFRRDDEQPSKPVVVRMFDVAPDKRPHFLVEGAKDHPVWNLIIQLFEFVQEISKKEKQREKNQYLASFLSRLAAMVKAENEKDTPSSKEFLRLVNELLAVAGQNDFKKTLDAITKLTKKFTGAQFYLSTDENYQEFREFGIKQLKSLFKAHLQEGVVDSSLHILFSDVRNAAEILGIKTLIQEAVKSFILEVSTNSQFAAALSETDPDEIRKKLAQIPIGYMFEDTDAVEKERQAMFRTLNQLQQQTGTPRFIGIGSNDLSKSINDQRMGGEVPLNLLNPLLIRDIWLIAKEAKWYGIPVNLEGEWGGSAAMLMVLLVLREVEELEITPVSAIAQIPELLELIRIVTWDDLAEQQTEKDKEPFAAIKDMVLRILYQDQPPDIYQFNEALDHLLLQLESRIKTSQLFNDYMDELQYPETEPSAGEETSASPPSGRSEVRSLGEISEGGGGAGVVLDKLKLQRKKQEPTALDLQQEQPFYVPLLSFLGKINDDGGVSGNNRWQERRKRELQLWPWRQEQFHTWFLSSLDGQRIQPAIKNAMRIIQEMILVFKEKPWVNSLLAKAPARARLYEFINVAANSFRFGMVSMSFIGMQAKVLKDKKMKVSKIGTTWQDWAVVSRRFHELQKSGKLTEYQRDEGQIRFYIEVFGEEAKDKHAGTLYSAISTLLDIEIEYPELGVGKSTLRQILKWTVVALPMDEAAARFGIAIPSRKRSEMRSVEEPGVSVSENGAVVITTSQSFKTPDGETDTKALWAFVKKTLAVTKRITTDRTRIYDSEKYNSMVVKNPEPGISERIFASPNPQSKKISRKLEKKKLGLGEYPIIVMAGGEKPKRHELLAYTQTRGINPRNFLTDSSDKKKAKKLLEDLEFNHFQALVREGFFNADTKRENLVFVPTDDTHHKLQLIDFDFVYEIPKTRDEIKKFLTNRDPFGTKIQALSPFEHFLLTLVYQDGSDEDELRVKEAEAFRSKLFSELNWDPISNAFNEAVYAGQQAKKPERVKTFLRELTEFTDPKTSKLYNQLLERFVDFIVENAGKSRSEIRPGILQRDQFERNLDQDLNRIVLDDLRGMSLDEMVEVAENDYPNRLLDSGLQTYVDRGWMNLSDVDQLAYNILSIIQFGEVTETGNFISMPELNQPEVRAVLQQSIGAMRRAILNLIKQNKNLKVNLTLDNPDTEIFGVIADSLMSVSQEGLVDGLDIIVPNGNAFKHKSWQQIPARVTPHYYKGSDPSAVLKDLIRLNRMAGSRLMAALFTSQAKVSGRELGIFQIIARIQDIPDKDLRQLAYLSALYAIIRFLSENPAAQKEMLVKPELLREFLSRDPRMSVFNFDVLTGNILLDSVRMISNLIAASRTTHRAA